MNNNILITGANGQLGSEFRDLKKNYSEYNFLFVDIDELNIIDENAVKQLV